MMNQDCQNIENHLIDIVENNLPESLKKTILDHLDLCPRCKRSVNSFSHAWKGLSTKEKFEPSERFWPELLAKIESSEKSQPFLEKMITGFRNSLRPAAVSLILLFGVFFGYRLGTSPRPETSPSEMSSQYIEQYLQDFQDFPYGSAGDFFTKYEIPVQEKKP